MILNNFQQINLKICIGFEFEFYILNKNQFQVDQTQFFEDIDQILENNQFDGYIEKEIELGQCEIISHPTFDIDNLFYKWDSTLNDLKSFFLNQNLHLNHKAKPFQNKSGNGLHINISLHDIKNDENIFGKEILNYNLLSNNAIETDKTKSKLLNSAIAGILHNAKNNIYRYINSESKLKRIYYYDRNTPTNISWGLNNRTTLIRLPEAKLQNKRIENRLPSSECDLKEITIKILEDIFFGIKNDLTPQKCTHGLAFDEQYNLQSLVDLYKNKF